MKISQVGIDLIKSFEGCRLKAYKPVPTEKYWTIGWGHYGPDIIEGMTITQTEADKMLLHDLQRYVDGVNGCVKVELTQNQFDALVSFAYNCGVGALQKSSLLVYLNNNNSKKAADEFLRFVHAGNKVLQGLVRRREAEKKLFLTKPAVKVAESDISTGKLTILKPINLWKDNTEGKLEMVRILKPNETYRTYGFREKHGGQWNVGAGHWITNIKEYIEVKNNG